MPALHRADQEQLRKLLLGQLSTADVERLATEYADDGRLAELAESLAGKDDALLALLHNHETAIVDPDGERLVERLLGRLKPAFPDKPREDTLAMNRADASTEPSSPDVTGKPQPLPERLEHYRPIKVLGQGGMGTVYLAEDTRLGREVAIKTLRPELAINPQAKERFLREARTAAKLEHDHIIPIYSVGEADGTPFLAMPLLKGEPLDALIRRTAGPLPVAMVLRIAREAASGLAAAHERGLIHRDIKPANIWLEAPASRVKILDFGLAKAADAGGGTDSETHLTASGAIVGTPAYMAPEQASGHPVDGRADLFSLGCVLYELLSGKRAFSGPNTMSILMSLANHTPTAPDKLSSQCPASLSRLVMQLLEKDPAKRPASADAVIQTLTELEIEPITTNVPASRVASAPGSSQDATAVRGLTPSGSPTLVESALPCPSNSTLTQPATEVLLVRKRAIQKQRVALTLAGGLLMLLAAVVYRIQTDQGTLLVEVDQDADAQIEAQLKDGGLEFHDKDRGRTWTVKPSQPELNKTGKYRVKPIDGLLLTVSDDTGAKLKTEEFTLERQRKVIVRVSLAKSDERTASVLPANPTTGGSAITVSPGDYALSFGDGASVVLPGVTAALDMTGPITIEVWVTPQDVYTKFLVPVVGRGGVGLYHDDSCWDFRGMWAQRPAENESYYLSLRAQRGKQKNRRTHVACVRNDKQVLIFVDGVPINARDFRQQPLNRDGLLTLGGANESKELKDFFFKGLIDEVRLSHAARYDKPFTPAARFAADADTLALYHFDEGAGDVLRDYSGNNHHGKIVGAKWVKADGTPIPATTNASAPPREGTVVPLFNGKDLTGWSPYGGRWKWEDGELVGTEPMGILTLTGERAVKNDFEVSFQARLADGKGVGTFVIRKRADGNRLGFCLFSTELGWGGVYVGGSDISAKPRPESQTAVRPDDFNDVTIRCIGKRLTIKINGVVAQDGDFDLPLEGSLAWEIRPPATELRIRKFQFKDLTVPASTNKRPAAPVDPGTKPPPPVKAPFDAKQARSHQEAWAKHLGTTVETPNSVGQTMILIPPGEFLMGSTDEQVEAAVKVAEEIKAESGVISRIEQSERPQHKVVISKPFLMSATEVTIGHFKKFAAAASYQTEAEIAEAAAKVSPSPIKPGQPPPKPLVTYLNPGHAVTDDSPAAVITWNDAVAYCKWLSDQEKKIYRLPTEAEWEYACRAGTTTQYSFGDDHHELPNSGWHSKTGGSKSHPVGTLLPNQFGLFDMHGNLLEWCGDWYDEKWYEKTTPNDPLGPSIGSLRVLRGGIFYRYASDSRSAYRSNAAASSRNGGIGFRCVAELSVPMASASNSTVINFAAERAVAEWVRSVGGTVQLKKADESPLPLMDGKLPSEPFAVDYVLIPGSAPIRDDDLDRLTRLQRLKSLLMVFEGRLTNACLSHVAKLETLEFLSISGAPISDVHLKQLDSLTKLKSVDIFGTKFVTDSGVKDFVTRHPELSWLTLGNLPEQRRTLTPLSFAPSLKRLSITSDQLTPEGADVLTRLPELVVLTIGNPTDEGLARLKSPRLKELQLEAIVAELPPLTVKAFADVQRLARLEILSIKGASGSPGDEVLSEIAKLPQLRSFELAFESKYEPRRYTPAGIEKFHQLRPEVKLQVDGVNHPATAPVRRMTN